MGATPDRIVMVPNGVDIPATTSQVGTNPPTAVFVANFRQCKGHDLLLDALALVTEPLVVRLMGIGSLKEVIRKQVDARGLGGRVQFVDSSANVPTELSRAQFAIHPSRAEGLSNAILEELASGLPVVATDVGGTRLLVENGLNGFLVPSGDTALLAKRISEMAASPTLRTSMTEAARSRAGQFAWDACADRYLDLFNRTTQQHRSPR